MDELCAAPPFVCSSGCSLRLVADGMKFHYLQRCTQQHKCQVQVCRGQLQVQGLDTDGAEKAVQMANALLALILPVSMMHVALEVLRQTSLGRIA